MTPAERHTKLLEHWNYLIHEVLPNLPSEMRAEAASRMQSIWNLDAESAQVMRAKMEESDAIDEQAHDDRDMLADLLSEVFKICRAAQFLIMLPQMKKFGKYLERTSTRCASNKPKQPIPTVRLEARTASWSQN